MKLGRLNRIDKLLLTKLIGLSPRMHTTQTTNHILSYFYKEEDEEDLPSLINELGVFSEKICQIENGLEESDLNATAY